MDAQIKSAVTDWVQDIQRFYRLSIGKQIDDKAAVSQFISSANRIKSLCAQKKDTSTPIRIDKAIKVLQDWYSVLAKAESDAARIRSNVVSITGFVLGR